MEGIQQTDVKKSRYESAKQPLVRYVKNPLVKYVKYQVVCSVLVLAFIALLIFAPIFSMDLGSLVGYDAYDVAAVQTLTKVQEAEEEALYSALETAKDNGDISSTEYNEAISVIENGGLITALENGVTVINSGYNDNIKADITSALNSAKENGDISSTEYNELISVLENGEISNVLVSSLESAIAESEKDLDSALDSAKITESFYNSVSKVLESGEIGSVLVSSLESSIADSETALNSAIDDFNSALNSAIDDCYEALNSALVSGEITELQYVSICITLADGNISNFLDNDEINSFLVSSLESAIAESKSVLESKKAWIDRSVYITISNILESGKVGSVLVSSLESAIAGCETALKSAIADDDSDSASAYSEVISTLESVSAYNEIISTLESVSAYSEIKSDLESALPYSEVISVLESSALVNGMFAISDGSSNSEISVGLVDDELVYTIVLGEDGGTISSVSVSVDTSDIVFSFSLFDELKLAFTSFGTMADATVSASVISFLIHIIALVLIGIAVVLAVISLVKNLPRACYSSSKYSVYNYTLNEYGEDVIAEIMYNPESKKDKFKNAIRNPLCLILGAIVLEFIGLIINGVINSTLIEKVTDLCEMIASGEIVEAIKVLASGETIIANATSYMSYMTGVNIWLAVVLIVAVLTLSVFIYCMSLKSNMKENILINSMNES